MYNIYSVAVKGQRGCRNNQHTETNSNTSILVTKILLTGKPQRSTLLSLTNRASRHSVTQVSRSAISAMEPKIHLLSQESQS